MTSSRLASDAITTVITPGASPVMVTEYMPNDGAGAQVINTAASGTIYAGTSSSVQQSNGIPIPAGASVQWTEPGQLWVVAGDDATDPITLITTARINSWTPSPEAVAIATATALLKQGIPNVLLGKTIFNGPLTENTALDVSQYASLNIQVRPNNAPAVIGYGFQDENAANLDTGQFSDADPALPITYRLPVSGPTLTLVPITANSPWLTVYGSNRTVPNVSVNTPNVPQTFGIGGAFASGSFYYPLDGNGFAQVVTDGPTTIYLQAYTANTAQSFIFSLDYIFYEGSTGALTTIALANSAILLPAGDNHYYNAEIQGNLPRCAGYFKIYNRSTITSGQYSLAVVS